MRQQRLSRPQEFRRVQKEGRGWVWGALVLRVAPNGMEESRFGFTVGRRVGNAVHRNWVKRRLREAVRLSPVRGGWDVVFIARKGAAETDSHQIRAIVWRLLRRSGISDEDGNGE